MANINDRINGQEYESASPLAHAVRYDRAQVKTEEQKKQARENIGCFCEAGGGGGSSGGETSSGGGVLIVHESYDEATDTYILDKTAAEILEAFETMPVIIINHNAFAEATFWNQYILTQVTIQDGRYTFVINQDLSFYAANDNDYPTDQQSSSGGGSH